MIEIKEFVQADALRPVKNRVALIETTMSEEEQNGIRIPQRRAQLFAFGQVVAMGKQVKDSGVTMGDNCLFQASPMFEKTIRYKIGEQFVLLMHSGDLIGTVLRGQSSTLAGFTPLGRWVIVERRDLDKVGDLYLPNQNNMVGVRRHFVAKVGPLVTKESELELSPGQEIFCDPNRVNPMRFTDVKGEYGFVDCGFIYGTMDAGAAAPVQPADPLIIT